MGDYMYFKFFLENTSDKSRHAYTLHVIDGNAHYSNENWLQRDKLPLRGFI